MNILMPVKPEFAWLVY